ncbi:hypothetical protein [Paraburkholderia fynbosensis]|uniref:hypothetical protein n=1 Tax=Paraburkholderia fynbosensis TaxID=1200993 RepID=UPI0015832031|nr:hypothetical protein [Paraburkholderia fynbosensis]
MHRVVASGANATRYNTALNREDELQIYPPGVEKADSAVGICTVTKRITITHITPYVSNPMASAGSPSIAHESRVIDTA